MPSVPILGDAELAELVAALRQADRTRRPLRLPPDFVARCTPDQALALQAQHLAAVLAERGGTVLGLKLGGTTEAALQALRLAAPFTGPILSARTQASPARLVRDEFIVGIVEAEIGLRLARDLPPCTQPPTREALLAAVDQVFPVIELADSRLARWADPATSPATAIVADLGYAGAWVPGQPCAGWRGLDLRTVTVTLRRDGELLRQGAGNLVLGDPLQALARVLVERGHHGLGLAAGTLVSTGSCTAPLPLPADARAGRGRYTADFGPLGQVVLDLV